MTDSTKTFFIQEHLPEAIFHGGVGNMDVEKIFLNNQLKPVLFPCHYSFSWWAKLVRVGYLVKVLCTLPRGAIVFFQHPLYAGMNKLLVKLLSWRKSIKVVCFIADINGLKHGDEALLKKEIKQFRTYHYFIVHNAAMQQWLQQQVPGSQVARISFFDFLAKPAERQRAKTMSVAFAGNLDKSSFLEKMDIVGAKCPSLLFNLYGPNVTSPMKAFANVNYKGTVKPYELPQALEGSFGLVWDGEEVGEAGGSMGRYMEYISHHKVSLYILSNMPLIVYEKAGSAGLVKQYNIGFTIRNLFEIEEKINLLSADEYQQMCKNTVDLAKKISSGACLTGALHEMIAIAGQTKNVATS